MATIVGVHGILQQQGGRHQLRAAWQPALADGLERATGGLGAVPGLDAVFYGDLFLPGPHHVATKGHDEDAGPLPPELAGVADDELDVLEAATDEIAGAESEGTKGFVSVPGVVQGLLRRLDEVFGSRAAGVLYLGALRQARGYLKVDRLKAAIDARADAAIGPDCRILIGHSLGSVVALEYLRRHPDHQVDLFLTVGSPLGLRLVQELLPEKAQRVTTRPANVAEWVNVWDPSDPVACAGGLSRRWSGVTDDGTANNQSDAHSATRYLSKRQVGAPIVAAMRSGTGARGGDGR